MHDYCYRELEIEGKKYATLMPADTPVILAGYEMVRRAWTDMFLCVFCVCLSDVRNVCIIFSNIYIDSA